MYLNRANSRMDVYRVIKAYAKFYNAQREHNLTEFAINNLFYDAEAINFID